MVFFKQCHLKLAEVLLQLADNVSSSKVGKSRRGPKKSPKRDKPSEHNDLSTAKLLSRKKPSK